ncbi:hypothetical protein J4218_06910 [Candidatus Pacearchaeota archaeon]|nr:hypothetical protein [Candidatus Pacearchaeota archaeon]
MEQLKQNQGTYFLFGLPVEAKLVYGPVVCSYPIDSYKNIPIEELIKRIKRDTGIDVGNKSNSFLTTATKIKDEFGDCMHEFVWFFFSKPIMN